MAFTLKVLKGFNTVNGRYCCNYNNNKNGMSKAKSFNTVNGEHCYFITFVFPSFQSGTRDVRSSSSLRSSAASHPSSHTVNGKYYSIITFVFPSLRSGTRDVRTPSSLCSSVPRTLRRIPQAVSTVATEKYEKPMMITAMLFQYRKR